MSVIEYATQQIAYLLSPCDKLELELFIDDISYSIDFFVSTGTVRKQCTDLIDEEIISESEYREVAKKIADYARQSSEYESGAINEFVSTIIFKK